MTLIISESFLQFQVHIARNMTLSEAFLWLNIPGAVFHSYVWILILLSALVLLMYPLFKSIIEKRRLKLEIKRLQDLQEDFRKRLEDEVTRRTREYEDELNLKQKMDAELKKALKRAEDAIYLKNAFLSNISHEIRTPLNGIIGFSSLLENELSLAENMELYEYANGISQSGERLMRLLNNLIDISRIEANDLEINLETCDLSQLVNDITELFRFKANEKGLKMNIRHNPGPQCLADPNNLMRILTEVIDNSLKYTEKGFINISTGYFDHLHEMYIRIKDTGIGIDPEYLPHIFEAFRQESLGFSRAFQGAGLGLPLARRIVELMNGRIEIESEKGNGTTVTVFLRPASLPVTVASRKKEDQVITSGLELRGDILRILVVEDDRMNRLVLKKMLMGFKNVELVPDGDEALRVIRNFESKSNPFHVILMDINLPAPWDGVTLMKKIREEIPHYKTKPFIAQTAYAMSGDRERFLDAGFNDYISKPVSKNQLFSMIENQLKLSEND